MTTHHQHPDRNRDLQDANERHTFVEIKYVEGGGHEVKVKGTGTEDPEVIVYNPGMLGHYPKDTDAEVTLISLGSDTNLKLALIHIPHDKERQWREGTNGIQKFDDPGKAVEFNSQRTHATDDNFAVGSNGAIEVVGNNVYIRGELHVSGNVRAASGPAPGAPAAVIPGFSA